jgi:heme-degrading monooxygenase HmoA
MYVVTNRVFVTADYRQQFEERFQRRAGQIDKQPGFIRMEIMRPQDENSPYLVMTHWADKAAFENWVGSEDFKLAHQNPMPKEAFTGQGGMEQHEVIIKAGQ